MNRFAGALGGVSLALTTTTAIAGGLERTIFSPAVLYEEGRYLEFGASVVVPELTGTNGVVAPPFAPAVTPLTGETGDLLETYATFGAAYKADINDRLSYALILGQPLGADTNYPVIAPTGPTDVNAVYSGSFADLVSWELAALLAYDVNDRVKIYGGPTLQTIEASAGLPFIPAGAFGSGYEVSTDRSWGVGAVVGASYEIPDIAFRVGLTYRSEVGHDFNTVETLGGVASINSQTSIDTPQSLTLDFRTGVAPDTLVFGQIHWVDWSAFNISPPNYPPLALGRPLVAYADDWVTYTLGVARRFDENWVGLASVSYEPQADIELTSLGPVDGRLGLSLGAIYENDKYKITGGVNYTMIGSALNVLQTDFDDGEALGFGIKFGIKL